jgi:hypothetical protein
MGGIRHVRGLDETIDKTIYPDTDSSLITATQDGKKRGLDVSIQKDIANQSETVPLLRSIEASLRRIEEYLQIITDENLG